MLARDPAGPHAIDDELLEIALTDAERIQLEDFFGDIAEMIRFKARYARVTYEKHAAILEAAALKGRVARSEALDALRRSTDPETLRADHRRWIREAKRRKTDR
jgi:hypothetical protein